MIRCTVGVMAYNEENNIVQVLQALLNQRLCDNHIVEIIVIASGCTDRTVELAQAVACQHPIVKVEVQARRAGKAAAINRLISLAQAEVIVLVGADTLPDPNALEHLVQPFAQPEIGMTGARVIPLNDPRTFLGFTIQMLWHMHHRLALRWPKLGELVAFRNIVAELPVNSATDEVVLEALIQAQGYRLLYVPEAIVYNRGPQTLDDFLTQRRRIFAGHLQIATSYHYVAASMPLAPLVPLMREAMSRYPYLLPRIAGAVLLECWGRILGTLDFLTGHRHAIWRPALSTKKVQQHHQSFTLVTLNCRTGSVNPAKLLRNARRLPASQGALFWWDQRHGQVLFMLPTDQLTTEDLEKRIKVLAAYISSPNTAAASSPVLSYRVVQFTPLIASVNIYAQEFDL
jgi:poly-beta-1,6-N-acetyl-D-glucosamine synthase